MNMGKTLFAQVMGYVPWKNFGGIIDRYGGDAGVRTLSCADLFRVMAFTQLTWRESLRDIEVCLSANQSKLFHMGMKGVPARSTPADAPNLRDWLDAKGDKLALLGQINGFDYGLLEGCLVCDQVVCGQHQQNRVRAMHFGNLQCGGCDGRRGIATEGLKDVRG